MKIESSSPRPIRIGLLAAEPIRMAGLASIFDQPAKENQPPLIPVLGGLTELLEAADIEHLVVDLILPRADLRFWRQFAANGPTSG